MANIFIRDLFQPKHIWALNRSQVNFEEYKDKEQDIGSGRNNSDFQRIRLILFVSAQFFATERYQLWPISFCSEACSCSIVPAFNWEQLTGDD